MPNLRFSPIKNREELMKAIEHVHFSCFKLCKRYFGRYLPASVNLGIFCHFPEEFDYLTKLREKLTDKNFNWNNKYFLLHEPLTIKSQYFDIPKTTYSYLYIRKPDTEKPQVGDTDLVLDIEEFSELKNQVVEKKVVNGVELYYRPDLNMIRLAAPDIDVLSYITTKYMTENITL